jgi:predicted nucleic acid-binding Zn ribbon protein
MEHMPNDKSAHQQCPICSAPVEASPRYPTYICGECLTRAVCEQGRRVSFCNTGLLGHGVKMVFLDHPNIPARVAHFPRHDLIFYLDGNKCSAQEAHFGGIVTFPCKE